MMKISEKIELVDLGIYVHKTLIFSDFHIGYEEALNKQGTFIPRFQFQEILKRLDAIFEQLKDREIQTIVVAGDLKHEFGVISEQEWRHTLRLLDYLGKKAQKIVLLKGNHDTILGPIAHKRNVATGQFLLMNDSKRAIFTISGNTIKKVDLEGAPMIDVQANNIHDADKADLTSTSLSKKTHDPPKQSRLLKKIKLLKNVKKMGGAIKSKDKNGILIVHGDIIPPKEVLENASTIIMGHEHPALGIQDGQRSETFKCFLIGAWEKKDLIAILIFWFA
mgnify:CR=1 FL=1